MKKKKSSSEVKKKKKVHNKNKYIFIIMLIALIMLIVSGVVLYVNYCDEKLLTNIKKHYGNQVIMVNDAKLYDHNEKVIGKVSKGFTFILDNKKINKSSEQYFKVKNTNYYIYYNDVKKVDKKIEDNFSNKYLVFNKNVVSKKTVFYKDNKKVLELKEKLNLPLEYMDDNYYYVSYLDKVMQVKKDESVSLNDNNNTSVNEASYISVINYDTIDNCTKDICVSVDNVRNQLNYLKEQGFSSISVDEYKLWLAGKIRLKEKSILLTTTNSNNNVSTLNNESNIKIEILSDASIKFSDVNKKSTKNSTLDKIERYVVKKTTSLDNFKKMSNGEDVVEVVKSASSGEQRIAVLNYHFFYDPTLGEECDESICLEVSKFREQLDYLKNNGYKTLKMSEFKKWMFGEIELPEKSVLITVDDGAKGTGKHNGNKLIPILEEYNMNATLFLITGWWSVENYRSKNLDIQSHTNDMHKYGTCGRGQLVCYRKDQALADLKKSLEIVDNNDSFCYPFYSYSDTAIQAVKEAGFQIAFVGGSVKARRSNNKYLIPRYPIYKTTTLNQFIKMVS